MRVREDVSYNLNYSLSGKLLLVGIKGINSFVKFDSRYADTLMDFIDQYKHQDIEPEELNDSTKVIYNNLNKLGYLDNGVMPRESFNEFKKVGKVFLSITPKGESKSTIGSSAAGIALFVFSIAAMLAFIASNQGYIPNNIDYIHMKLWEIIFTISVFPWAVLAVHELGHCLMAKYVGVKIDNVSFGWFFIYPIVLVQYYGLNLEKQSKKLMVMAGGIYFNLIMAFVGILLKTLLPDIFHGAVIDIWISANISTIITNLGLFGMTDGYFMVTMLAGILDIRLKGYKYLNSVMKRSDTRLGNDYRTCGLILAALFISGLVSIYFNLNFWLSLFGLNGIIFYIVFTVFMMFLTGRFLMRIKNVF